MNFKQRDFAVIATGANNQNNVGKIVQIVRPAPHVENAYIVVAVGEEGFESVHGDMIPVAVVKADRLAKLNLADIVSDLGIVTINNFCTNRFNTHLEAALASQKAKEVAESPEAPVVPQRCDDCTCFKAESPTAGQDVVDAFNTAFTQIFGAALFAPVTLAAVQTASEPTEAQVDKADQVGE